jgi:hypothetical protein
MALVLLVLPTLLRPASLAHAPAPANQSGGGGGGGGGGDEPPGPKTVFAHYMMCFHAFGNCTPGPKCSSQGASSYIQGYKTEIEIAQRYGLDGWALEWLGHEMGGYYNESFYNIFQACEEYNAERGATAETAAAGGPQPFVLIPMLDGGNFTATRLKFLTHVGSTCQYRFQDRPVLSNWGGGIPWHNKTGDQGAIKSAEWEAEIVQPMAKLGHARPFYLPFIYPPNYDVPPTLSDQVSILDNFTALDGLWYWGCADLGDAVAQSSSWNIEACQQRKKYSASPVSAPYSPHKCGNWNETTQKFGWCNNVYYQGNGAQGMMQTWMAHIKGFKGKQPDFVIYTTWNDLAEHHYLGPYNHTFWGLANETQPQWHTEYPHIAYLQLSRYFIQWYKQPAGSAAPAVAAEDEAVFYFYNLQSVLNKCPLDKWGPPAPGHGAGHDTEYPKEDMVYVTSLLAEPGTLTIESGLPFTKPPGNGIAGFTIPVGEPSSTRFQLPAGLHSVKVPALAGGQRFTFERGGGKKVVATGSEGINTTELSAIVCNVQTFTGVLTVKDGSD